jgi:hypothetical protein
MKKVLLFLLIVSFISCKEKNRRILLAENKSYLDGNTKLELFADSSYLLIDTEFDTLKKEITKGKYKILNDTLFLSQNKGKFKNLKKAILKNGFVEYIDLEYTYKIEIKTCELFYRNNLNFKEHNDYSFFTFSPTTYRSEKYNYLPNSLSAYDINQKELIEIAILLEKFISENNPKLKKHSDYLKQCVVVKNSKNEIIVWVSCYCSFNNDKFKQYLIEMNDGGNCNVNLKLNLTKKYCYDLNISGGA